MYKIEKLNNYFEFNTFHDAHFQRAYETLDFENKKYNCNKKYWQLFKILKKTHRLAIKCLNKKDIAGAEFLIQQVSMGSFTLGLECVATYTNNIDTAICAGDHDKALRLFEDYQNYKVFENAEKAIKRYIKSLPTFYFNDLKYFKLPDFIDFRKKLK